MAVSGAITYRVLGLKTSGVLGKFRNLGISFMVMGYVFVPELFNPFINRNKI